VTKIFSRMATFPPIAIPPQLKSLSHYLKLASEHDQRDPVISYWCRFHAVQSGLAIDKTSKEATSVLITLLGWLEERKKELHDNEAITNESVAEAHLENYILKLFNIADGQDRSGVFNKNVIKAFYTAGQLVEVLRNFNDGQLSEEFERIGKYAKWKAAYIHNCLKNGETPVSGPTEEEGEDGGPGPAPGAPNQDQIVNYQSSQIPTNDEANRAYSSGQPTPSASSYSQPRLPSKPEASFTNFDAGTNQIEGPVPLGVDQISKAQKYCKWAGSALNFDDVPTAITNLENALTLLKTGRDEG